MRAPELRAVPLNKGFKKEFQDKNGDNEVIQAMEPDNRFWGNIKPIFCNQGNNSQEGHWAHEDGHSISEPFRLGPYEKFRHEQTIPSIKNAYPQSEARIELLGYFPLSRALSPYNQNRLGRFSYHLF